MASSTTPPGPTSGWAGWDAPYDEKDEPEGKAYTDEELAAWMFPKLPPAKALIAHNEAGWCVENIALVFRVVQTIATRLDEVQALIRGHDIDAPFGLIGPAEPARESWQAMKSLVEGALQHAKILADAHEPQVRTLARRTQADAVKYTILQERLVAHGFTTAERAEVIFACMGGNRLSGKPRSDARGAATKRSKDFDKRRSVVDNG